MHQRPWQLAALSVLLLLLAGGAPAAAQYRYRSSYGGSGGGDSGFVLSLEGFLANPRNVDNVVATEVAGTSVQPIVPNWDDEPAGRLGVGYEWSGRGKLLLSVWAFEAEQAARGSGSSFAFSIGPPIPTGGGQFIGASGNFFDITSEITARTADLAFAREHELAEAFSMEWSAGLRYATFEETHAGEYRDGSANVFAADKSHEGEMIGAKVGARGAYRIGAFSFSSGLGFSMLDGKITADSSLTRTSPSLLASRSAIDDDSRSGSIRDFDVMVAWHLANERYRLSLGWEQSEWRDIAADLMRDFPGSAAPLRQRESVIFSGAKLGLRIKL